jgi:hypothetical protein
MDLRSKARNARGRIARAGRIVWGREWAGRNMTVLSDDVFLVSFPRSGSTWLRFLMGNLVHTEGSVTFANIESVIPYVDIHSDKALLRAPRPRILESHETFCPWYPKVIYIVRDPRDVAVSYHYILKKDRWLPEDFSMDEFLPLFLEGRDFGVRLGPWASHVMSWTKMRQNTPGFLLLRYEDVLADTSRELSRVAGLLNVPASSERIERAVEMSAAGRMRSLEKTEGRLWKTTRRSRQDMPFVRSARSGDWKTILPEKAVLLIESAWGAEMRALGYPLLTNGTGTLAPSN